MPMSWPQYCQFITLTPTRSPCPYQYHAHSIAMPTLLSSLLSCYNHAHTIATLILHCHAHTDATFTLYCHAHIACCPQAGWNGCVSRRLNTSSSSTIPHGCRRSSSARGFSPIWPRCTARPSWTSWPTIYRRWACKPEGGQQQREGGSQSRRGPSHPSPPTHTPIATLPSLICLLCFPVLQGPGAALVDWPVHLRD